MNETKTGKLIRETRMEKNMTQQDLASVLNVSPTTVSKWENGRSLPDISLLDSLASIFDLSIEEIIRGERIPHGTSGAEEQEESAAEKADNKGPVRCPTDRKKWRIRCLAETVVVLTALIAIVLAVISLIRTDQLKKEYLQEIVEWREAYNLDPTHPEGSFQAVLKHVADEKSLQEAERQRKAIMAQEALMRVWGYDKDGNSLYPKSFAGFWIEEDQLVIGITEYTDEEMGSYRDSAGAYAESLRFVERQYSYHDLDEETIKIGKYLMEKGAPVSQYYVDELENRIVIGLACEEAELSKWEALLEGEFECFPVAFTSLPYVWMAAADFSKGK